MKFRKRPVVIEAYQVDQVVEIPTLEGVMRADPGDWIITGVQGEHYPCKPDIFVQTYEPAEAETVVWVGWSYGSDGAELLGVFLSEAAAEQALLQAAHSIAGTLRNWTGGQDFTKGTDGARVLTAGDRRFEMSPQPIQR